MIRLAVVIFLTLLLLLLCMTEKDQDSGSGPGAASANGGNGGTLTCLCFNVVIVTAMFLPDCISRVAEGLSRWERRRSQGKEKHPPPCGFAVIMPGEMAGAAKRSGRELRWASPPRQGTPGRDDGGHHV